MYSNCDLTVFRNVMNKHFKALTNSVSSSPRNTNIITTFASGTRGEVRIFFYSVLHSFQDSSSYETGQSVGGAKTGEPREKQPGTPASRTWHVSYMASAGLESAPDTAMREVRM